MGNQKSVPRKALGLPSAGLRWGQRVDVLMGQNVSSVFSGVWRPGCRGDEGPVAGTGCSGREGAGKATALATAKSGVGLGQTDGGGRGHLPTTCVLPKAVRGSPSIPELPPPLLSLVCHVGGRCYIRLQLGRRDQLPDRVPLLQPDGQLPEHRRHPAGPGGHPG